MGKRVMVLLSILLTFNVMGFFSNQSVKRFSKVVRNSVKEDKVLVLESSDTVVFRGAVTESSVAKVMAEFLKKSKVLPKSKPMYLILNTPGGSVFAGLDLIDFIKGLGREVHTVTLFAASMGFQFAQNLGRRYITPNGTLMSHRASLRGIGGQIYGELEQRLKMIKSKVDSLDRIAAKRMNVSLIHYRFLTLNEYWVHGFDAVQQNSADEKILIRCGNSLQDTSKFDVNTIFGKVEVETSDCPLIKAPLSLKINNVVDLRMKQRAISFVKNMLKNPSEFVNTYIVNGKYREFLID